MGIKPYIRKTLYVVSLLLLVVLFAMLYQKQSDQICTDVVILIDAPEQQELISVPYVKDRLDEWYEGGVSGMPKTEVDLRVIEEQLEDLPAIRTAEVSFDLRGILTIEIVQRIPCLRVVRSNGNSFYLDREEAVIPAEGLLPARVPVLSGRFGEGMIKKVYTLSTHVQENPFMNALTEQIFVNSNGDLVIVPKIKDQRIIIGDTTRLENKFEQLIDFYRHGLNKIGWDQYRTINVKFKDQVVCS